MSDSTGSVAGRAGGALTGVGSASGGLVIGPDTVAGKVLIIASPLVSLLVDYAAVQTRAALGRWEALRPLRQAKRTLKAAIKDPHVTEEHKASYRERLAELHDVQIDSAVARARAVLVPNLPPGT